MSSRIWNEFVMLAVVSMLAMNFNVALAIDNSTSKNIKSINETKSSTPASRLSEYGITSRNLTQYQNPVMGTEFKYPSEWKIESYAEGVRFSGEGGSLEIEVHDFTDPKKYIFARQGISEGVEISPVTIASYKGIKVLYDPRDIAPNPPVVPTKAMIIFIINGNAFYSIKYEPDVIAGINLDEVPRHEDNNIDQIQNMLSKSLRLTTPTNR